MAGSGLRQGWELALLILILAFALGTRLGHTQKGLPYLHHVDEPHTTAVALDMLKTGDLNPHRFHYGSLNIYSLVAVDAVHYLWISCYPDALTGKRVKFDEIQPTTRRNWRWETSHPSFNQWNRAWSSILGTLTVLLVYLVGRRASAVVGLTAAATLAGISVHIEHSGLVSPDIPVGFYTLLAVVLSTAYMKSGRVLTLVWAFVATGLALATKYNGAPILVVPYLALAFTVQRHRVRPHWLWWGGLLTTLGVFFVCNPFAILDLPLFIDHVGQQVSHYAFSGHGPRTIEPGLPHILLSFRQFASSLTWPGFVLAALGVAWGSTNRRRIVLFSFPALYFLLQTQMVVAFHRNLLSVYPFLALGLGFSVQHILTWSAARWPKCKPVLITAIVVLFARVCVIETRRAYQVATTDETRSVAGRRIVQFARERGWKRIGISELLRIHPLDLVGSDVKIVSSHMAHLQEISHSLDAIVSPTSYELKDVPQGRRGDRLERRQSRIPTAEPIWRIEGNPCQLGSISIDPGVQIFVPPYDHLGDG